MIDIHCHLLPGVDDGAVSMSQALNMAEIAAASGVSAICVTPHTNLPELFENYESLELADLFEQLQKALRKERIPLKLVRGAEVFMTPKTVDLLQTGKIITMNHTKQCLIEFDFDVMPNVIDAAVRQCLAAGYRPILAHPERYYAIQDNPDQIYHWVRQGTLTQVNKGSILGEFDLNCEMCADYLLDEGLVTCIASDAHGTVERGTDMREISAYIRRVYGDERQEQLLRINPGKMAGLL